MMQAIHIGATPSDVEVTVPAVQVHMYAYTKAVVTAKTGYVSGSLHAVGKDAGISVGQAIHMAGACPASYAVCSQV